RAIATWHQVHRTVELGIHGRDGPGHRGKQGINVHRSAGLLGHDAGIYSYRSYTTVISDADACVLQNVCGNPMQAVAVSQCTLVHQTSVRRVLRELLTYSLLPSIN